MSLCVLFSDMKNSADTLLCAIRLRICDLDCYYFSETFSY